MIAKDAIRVALFVPSFRGGGAEKVMLDIANELAARGYLVDFIVLEVSGPYKSRLSSDVRLIDLDARSMRRCIGKLAKYLTSEKPYSIMSTGLHSSIALMLSTFFTRSKSKTVSREGLPLNHEIKQGALIKILTLLLYGRFDVFVSLTKCQEIIRQNIVTVNRNSKQYVIPNPLDIDALSKNSSLTPELKFPPGFENTKLLVGCGRLVEQKNFKLLIDSFAVVRKSVECKLIILGEGEERAALEAQVKSLGLESDVWLAGFVHNPMAFVQMASVFVLTSWFEGMPNSLLHAYSIGVPCVATDCECGPSEIFSYPGQSRLVPVNEESALTLAILDLIKNESAPVRNSQLSTDFSLANVCDKYEIALGLREHKPI